MQEREKEKFVRAILTREEVKAAIRGDGVARPPLWYLDFPDETVRKYGGSLRRLLERYAADFRYAGAAPKLKKLGGKNSYVDEWGVVLMGTSSGVGLHPEIPPIADWSGLDEYLSEGMPRAGRRGRFAEARRLAKRRGDAYLLALSPAGFFERMQALVGIKNFYESLLEHPEEIERLGRAILDFGLEAVDEFGELGYDGYWLGDDVGSQMGLLVSGDYWRRMFKPWYKELFERVRSYGMDVVFHSCGNVTELVEDFLEMGVDVLHPLQPGCVDREEMGRKYGGRVCFYTGVDVQNLLIRGSTEEIREDVGRIKEIFRNERGGGLIIGPTNAISPDTPLANVEAFLMAAVE